MLALYLHHQFAVTGHDRAPAEREPLSRHAFRHAEHLVVHDLGVHRADRAADRRGLDGVQPRRLLEERLVRARFDEPAAQPARAMPGQHGRFVRRRDVQDDVTRAVERLGRVVVDFAVRPAVAVPGLPFPRRVVRVDALALDLAGHPQQHRAAGHRIGQSEKDGVTRRRNRREGRRAPADQEVVRSIGGREAGGLGGDGEPVQSARDDGQRAFDGEHDRIVDLIADTRDLTARRNLHGGLPGRREPERDVAMRGGGREQAHPDEVEEAEVVQAGHPVEPVQQLVHHMREGLDQRDAGVGDVVVRPLRTVALHQQLGLVHEILEAAVVEIRRRQGHWAPASAGSCGGMT